MKQKSKTLLLKSFLILLILSLGTYLRTINLNWDQGHHLHPDERFLTMVGNKIKWPQNIREYFNTDLSPLSPYNQDYGFFVYGTLPLFLVKRLAILLKKDNYDQFNLLGRQISAILDLGTLILIGFIAKRIIKKHWPWAFFIYAISVLPIQLAHFFAVGTCLNFFLTATFLSLIIFYQKSSKIFLASAGVLLGMALACKITAALFTPIAELFIIMNSFKKKNWQSFFINEAILAIFLFFSFRFFQPYAFTNIGHINLQFITNLKENQKLINTPNHFFPPAIQWLKTTPILFPVKNIILWGLGLPLGIITFIAIIFSPLIREKKQQLNFPLWINWFWITLLIVIQGSQYNKTMRYFLIIYPSLAIITGNFVGILLEKIKSQKTKLLVTILTVTIFLVWPLSFIKIYSQPHSRVIASEWIYKNIPQRVTISCEHWDDCLPLPIENKNSIAYHYKIERLQLYDADTNKKWQKINQQLDQVDYLILSSNRLWGSIPKVPDIYPQTAQFYQDLFANRLNWRKIAEFTSYPGFPPLGKSWFFFPDQNADEAFTVYDHPKVIIFEKTVQ